MAKDKKVTEDLIEEPGMGHNSFSGETLIELLEKLENLAEEKANIGQDIKLVMDAAAQKGFDKRTIREMLKLRAMDVATRNEREELRDLYLTAIGLA